MELEIYNAFVKAGVSEVDAKAAVESINREIDKRFSLHAQQLATKGDLSEMESRLLRALNDMQRWTLGTIFAGVAVLAVITKLWH